MVITNLGNGCIKLQNGDTVLLVDPTSARVKGDAVIRTITMMTTTPQPEKHEVVFPGEYEVAGIEILGVRAGSDASSMTTAYVVTWEGIRVMIVGDHDVLPSGDALEAIELRQPEVVILPMSTKDQATWAAKIAKQLESNVVIPVTYSSLADIKAGFGETPTEDDRFTFKKKDLALLKQKLVVVKAA